VNFYWDYYSQGKAIYTKVNYPSLEEIIKLIKSHGGISILAHPGNNLKNQFELFDEMVQLGLDGVEAFSSYHDQKTCEYFYNKAKELNVYYTCGSDFHGKTKPSIHLGDCHCNVEINIDLKGLAHDE
jgi:predicted metal-dependent phosphoesterase TrpH